MMLFNTYNSVTIRINSKNKSNAHSSFITYRMVPWGGISSSGQIWFKSDQAGFDHIKILEEENTQLLERETNHKLSRLNPCTFPLLSREGFSSWLYPS